MFLTIMIAGLVGLLVMAFPAFLGHGHHALGGGRALGGHHTASHLGAVGKAAAGRALPAKAGATGSVISFLPSPRTVFSLMALGGAFANAFVQTAHLSELVAALLAVVPAVLVERLVVLRVWNLLFRFQANPSSPLEHLVLAEAKATTPFRNGKGLVAVSRDGRLVQLPARLAAGQERTTIEVGDSLVVDDVDAAQERVTVSPRRE